MKTFMMMLAAGVIVPALSLRAAAEPITLAENGKSAYSIHFDANAPTSVKRVATELRIYIEKTTGAKVLASPASKSPMISVGLNEHARAAGVDKDLPDIGFRIGTKGKDIFILGNDSPDGQEPWYGMGRNGTRLGVYDFIERVLNVRWLMPGETGEDAPRVDKLVVPDLDVREVPSFNWRWLVGLKDHRGDLTVWNTRNRIDFKPGGAGVNWSHSFNSYPPNDVLKQHPEFMAMKADGTRLPVPRPGAAHVMYCLSNPELVQAYADALIAVFDRSPKLFSMSMSPDEGAPFCVCPQCSAVAMPVKAEWKDVGAHSPQRTPAVIHFYNEVARRVRAKYPDRVLGGMVYQDYMVPLDKPVQMEPNIVLAPAINSSYGFKSLQPQRMAVMQRLFDEWGKYGVPLGYYSHDTWMRNWFGVPLPPGKSLLKWIFPLVKRNGVQYLTYVGQEGWGYSGVHNYIVAKLMWNSDADVEALYNEFLTRAYGSSAAPVVDRIYTLLDAQLQTYILSKRYPDHEIDYVAAKEIYAPIFADLEKLYFEALEKTEGMQRARLERFGDNLVQAHYHLRHANLLPGDVTKSPLYRDDDAFKAFIAEKEVTPSIIPVSDWVKTYRYDAMPVLKEGWKPK